jgi:hypothetical protein
LLPIVGTTSQFSADEGAAIAQAVHLEQGDGWTEAHPFPAADPDRVAFPLELSQREGDRYAPFARHPVYALLLAGALRIGGRSAPLVLSVLGTVTAALLSALLARRLDPDLGVLALWVVGIASPLGFDSYIVIAHTLGAALAGAAVLLIVRALESDRTRWSLLGVIAVLGAGVVLRTEMVFFAVACGLAVLVIGRSRRAVPWTLVAAPMVAGVGGYVLDALAQSVVMGGSAVSTAPVTAQPPGFLASRVLAFVITWLLPSYSFGVGVAVLLVAAALGVFAVVLARRDPPERDGVRLFACVAAAAAVARLAFPAGAVPGLLIAFPLLTCGLVALPRNGPATAAGRLFAVTAGLFALAVLATQYGTGGSGEWGGRYFAIALPVATPVVLVALRRVARRLDTGTIRIAGAALALLSVALFALGIVTLRQSHRDVDAFVSVVGATARSHPAGDGDRPVVLADNGAAGRFAFEVVDQTRWLTVKPELVDGFAARLEALHIQTLTFVTRDEKDIDRLAGAYRVDVEQHTQGDWIVVVMVSR